VLLRSVRNQSRNFAIKNGKTLISLIEEHKYRMGTYPASLQELQVNPSQTLPGPCIMGIPDFRYNKIDELYSLSFSQWLDLGSLEEIVLYDKNDLRDNLKGALARYDYGFDLCRIKGAFASYNAGPDHWRYYLL